MSDIILEEPIETHILGVRQLLAILFSEDISQFGAIFELCNSSQMEILFSWDGLTSQINNLKRKQQIIPSIVFEVGKFP